MWSWSQTTSGLPDQVTATACQTTGRVLLRPATPYGYGMPKTPRRPDPPPLETDDRPIVLVGLALWVIAFVVLLVFFRDDLRRHDTTWWLWACAIGFVLGLYGLRVAILRNRSRGRRSDAGVGAAMAQRREP